MAANGLARNARNRQFAKTWNLDYKGYPAEDRWVSKSAIALAKRTREAKQSNAKTTGTKAAAAMDQAVHQASRDDDGCHEHDGTVKRIKFQEKLCYMCWARIPQREPEDGEAILCQQCGEQAAQLRALRSLRHNSDNEDGIEHRDQRPGQPLRHRGAGCDQREDLSDAKRRRCGGKTVLGARAASAASETADLDIPLPSITREQKAGIADGCATKSLGLQKDGCEFGSVACDSMNKEFNVTVETSSCHPGAASSGDSVTRCPTCEGYHRPARFRRIPDGPTWRGFEPGTLICIRCHLAVRWGRT